MRELSVERSAPTRTSFRQAADTLFLVLLIVVGSGANLTEKTEFDSAEYNAALAAGNLSWQIAFLAICAYAGFRLLQETGPLAWQLVKAQPLVPALAGVCLVSVFWSVDPSLSLRRGIVLAGMVICLLHSAAALRPAGLLRGLALAAVGLVIASFLVSILLPQYGTMTTEDSYFGAWRGVFGQKNLLAKNMVACAAILACYAAIMRGRLRPIVLGLAFLAVALLFAARSATSLLTATIVAAVAVCHFARRAAPVDRAAFVLAAAAVGAVLALVGAYVGMDGFFGMLDRDASLTGRTNVWAFVLPYIDQHFWFGYGYAGFWTNAIGEVDAFLMIWDWMPFHAHNGILELWLQIGAVGVCVFVILVLLQCRFAVLQLARAQGAVDVWPALVTALLLITNVSEVAIAAPYDLTWTLFVCACFASARAKLVARRTEVREPLAVVRNWRSAA